MGISKKFSLYFLLPLLVLLALMGTLIYFVTYSHLQRQADANLLTTADAVSLQISERINVVRSDLTMTRTYKGIDSYFIYTDVGQLDVADRERTVVQDNFVAIGKLKPRYSAVRFYDKQGSGLINVINGKVSYKTIDASGADWFKKTLRLKAGDSYVSNVYTSSEYADPTITISQPVYFKNKVRGVLAIDARVVDIFGDLIEGQSVGERGYAYLVGSEGKILVHKDSSIVPFYIGADVSGLYSTQRLFEGYKGIISAKDEEGAIMMRKVYMPLESSNMGLVISVPTDEVFKPVIQMRNTVLPITILGLVVLVAIGVVMIKTLTNPIKHLTDVANKISKGDMDVKVEVSSKDEIGDLAESFERMVASIKILMAEDSYSEPSEES